MADADPTQGDTSSPIPAPDATEVPALSDFLTSLPTGEAQDWGQKAADTVTDWLGQQAIATRNSQIGQRIVDDVNNFSNTMVGLIHRNPTATDMAVSLGDQIAEAMVRDHPHLPDEVKPELTAQLKTELGQKFATAGIIRWAQVDSDNAHRALEQYGHLYTPEVRQQLGEEIDRGADARAADNAQQQVMAQKAKANQSFGSLLNYASSLVDGRGEARVPPGFNQKTWIDQGILPADTDIAQRLADYATKAAAGGEQTMRTSSDNVLKFVQDNLTGDATPQQILQDVGSQSPGQPGVRLQDAVLLAKLATNKDDLREFGSVLGAAKMRIQGPDGQINFGSTGQARLDILAHDLLLRYSEMGKAAFADLPRDPTAILKSPDKLVGYQQWPELQAIFQRQSAAPARNGVTVLRGGGEKQDLPGAQQAALTAEEDFASTTQRERARARTAFQTMLPAEAQKVWAEAQGNIEAARAKRDQARQEVTDARRREIQEAKQERQAQMAEARRARLQAAAENRQARAEAAAMRAVGRSRGGGGISIGGGGGGRSRTNDLEEFQRGARLIRRGF